MKELTEYKDKKIAVLGFAVEGQETVEFLIQHGAKIHVFDERDETTFDKELLLFYRNQGIEFTFGMFDSFKDFNIVVRSPSVKPGRQPLHEAGDLGIAITSRTNIFLEHALGTTVGVTGTKGKGTTVALLYAMLKAADRDVYMSGNIGTPTLMYLQKLTDESITILELSSFQLMDVVKSPDIAVVLMVTRDHLDYHTSLEEYVFAKQGIAKHQKETGNIIFNVDYAASKKIADTSQANKFHLSTRESVDNGCYVEKNAVVVKQGDTNETLIKTREILLPGKHNLENVCAAVMAAKILGVSNEHIVETLKTFRGLEHRLELVRELNGVRYYNDSYGTTPETAIAAIKAFEGAKILILGGSNKNSDFTELGKVISESKNIKAIIGIGEEWPKIKAKLKRKKIKIIEGKKTMASIVHTAKKIAQEGDVILFSPACASFDMFKNIKDRGNQFKTEVNNL